MRRPMVFFCSVFALLLPLLMCRTTLPAQPAAVTVPILMFHDVKASEGGTWSISAANFRSTLVFLLNHGYTPVFFDDLVNFVDGTEDLPDKPVVITLDDGYFSNYRYVLPIITELEIPVTVFMTCGTVRMDGTVPSEDENVLCKMSLEELIRMQSSPYVKIQSHSYAMHGVNTSYGTEERDNSLPLESEDKETYTERFSADCVLAEAVLQSIGADTQTAFSYPSGKHHPLTEDILWERGYRVSVTTDNSHRNRVVQGDCDSLRLLGRMNVNDTTTEESLVLYLARE